MRLIEAKRDFNVFSVEGKLEKIWYAFGVGVQLLGYWSLKNAMGSTAYVLIRSLADTGPSLVGVEYEWAGNFRLVKEVHFAPSGKRTAEERIRIYSAVGTLTEHDRLMVRQARREIAGRKVI